MVRPLLLAVLLGLALAGCTNKMEVAEAQLGAAVSQLPGVYERQEPALVMAIVPIYAPTLSDYVFYVQEMAANDLRRITAQRVMSFDPVKGGKILQTNWALTEPARWRDGHMHPELFKSMVRDDVRAGTRGEVEVEQISGTELVFDAGGRLVSGTEAGEGARYRKR